MALKKVLFIDAYDSFSENIAALLTQVLNVQVTMIHIDTPIDGSLLVFVSQFDAVVLGPGPGNPTTKSDIGLFSQVWSLRRPVLGICLGFQSLCVAFGASIAQLARPCHGHARNINHNDQSIFTGVGHVVATNYNSLEIRLDTEGSPSSESSTPESDLVPLAWDDYGTLMAVQHVSLPFWGLQFHPESCKSNDACHDIILNWGRECAKWSPSKVPNTLSPGHIWSRPLSPATSKTTLHDKLRELTADCSVVQHKSSYTSSVADLCRELSPNDCVMLESTRRDRYSIYAFPHPESWRIEYYVQSSTCSIKQDSTTVYDVTLPQLFDELHSLLADHTTAPCDRFQGGFVGYLSYEAGLVNIGVSPQGLLQTDVSLLWVDRSIIYDHHSQTAHVQSIRANDSTWIDHIIAKLDPSPIPTPSLDTLLSSAQLDLPSEITYKSQIRALQAFLYSGDSYELCLTTAAHVSFPQSQPTHTPQTSYRLYRRLTTLNSAPFSAYLSLGNQKILSSSPEQFLTLTAPSISMKPMKGTVRKTPGMTLALATALLATPKESAENLMIADLIRHDLYSALGWDANITVPALCAVEELETVYQLTSHIRAEPVLPIAEPDRTRAFMAHGHRALRAALPPGSMTGAPKKRSCEILGRIEKEPRGVYAGVIGFLGIGGAGSFSVCIRTAVSEGTNSWRVGAGGAVTVLSDEDGEWREMQGKLESVLRAFRPDDPARRG